MIRHQLFYKIEEIPDPLFPQYLTKAGGNVGMAVRCGIEQLIRTVTSQTPSSLSISMLFCFNPEEKKKDPQSRLRIYITACNLDQSGKNIIQLLIERSPLTNFYRLIQMEKQPTIFWNKLKAACKIVRREEAVTPLHSGEFNDRIPAHYYAINQFEPRKNNDYTDIDRVLDNINKKVVVKFSISPAEITREISEHTRYLARLQSINRAWNETVPEDVCYTDYIKSDSTHHYRSKSNLQILRYRDPIADNILRTQQRFHESLGNPHLLFDISVLAETPAIARLVGSTVAESALENGSYRLLSQSDEADLKNILEHAKSFKPFYSPTHNEFFPNRDPDIYSGLARFSHLATVEELSTLFCLPVSSVTSPFCIRKNTDPMSQNEKEFIVFGRDQEGSREFRGPLLQKLCAHLSVFGMSGFGKSTAGIDLCLQLNHHNIPFIVFEPVKSEYRIIKTLKNHPDKNARQLAKKLEIYTPGNEQVSRFRLNPLEILPGISKDEHIEGVLSCFKASMPLSGPLPAILGEALERVYEISPEITNPPRMVDLVKIIPQILSEKGYSKETSSDILAASEVRVSDLTRRSIGKIFQCKNSSPQINHLINNSSIIEMDCLHEDSTCLNILLILINIFTHLKTVPKSGKSPRLVIIIEEAHNIVGNYGKASASADFADPKPFAAELICRILAEIRALGVCVVIIDQSPTAVAPQVIKLTSTKLAFRQVERDDREELAAAMLLSETEMEDIARFTTGDAFILTESYHKSRRIKTTNIHDKFDLNLDVKNNRIIPYLHDDPWYQKACIDITASELSQLLKEMNSFDDERIQLVSQLVTLQKTKINVLQRYKQLHDNKIILTLIKKASFLKQAFITLLKRFTRDSYNRLMPSETMAQVNNKEIDQLKNDLKNRFKKQICPDIKNCINIIDSFINQCKTDLQEEIS